MIRKTLIQFAHFGKQIYRLACFIRLFSGANYDLNCNSPRLFASFVRLVAPALLRKSSELQQEGYLLKTILLSWLFRALLN